MTGKANRAIAGQTKTQVNMHTDTDTDTHTHRVGQTPYSI